MKSSRLTLILFPLLVLLTLGLAACQETPTAPSEATASATATARPTRTPRPQNTATPQPTATLSPYLDLDETTLRGMQVVFWHPWRGDLADRFDDAVEEFNRTNSWGLIVRAQAMGSLEAEIDAMNALADAETPSSAAPVALAAPPEDLVAWLAQGRLAALDDYVAQSKWALTEPAVSAFQADFWMQDQLVGASGEQQAGIPALRSARVLFYNETWAGELGFSHPPMTPEEFRAQACAAAQANNALAEDDKHFTGGWLIDTDALTMLSWLDGFGAQVLPATENAVYSFQSVQANAAAAYLRDLFDQGCAWEGRSPTPYEYFTNRMALFYSGTFQDMVVQAETQQRLNSGDRWRLIAYPTEDGSGTLYSSGYSYGILAGEPKQQLAGWLFIRWMADPQRQSILAEAYPSFPVDTASSSRLSTAANRFPLSMILPLETVTHPAPSLPSWLKVRLILEDAALMQLYRLPVDQMPYFLPELDRMAGEVVQGEIER